MSKKKQKTSTRLQARILSSPEPVREESAKDIAARHWSACPYCGTSKLSPAGTPRPSCTHSGPRVESQGREYITQYMRCNQCDQTYKAMKPDS